MPLGYFCCSCCRGVHILEKKKVMCVSCCIGCVEEQQFHYYLSPKRTICHDTCLSRHFKICSIKMLYVFRFEVSNHLFNDFV